jgi:Probable cobalt transporter subunit (CbtA)
MTEVYLSFMASRRRPAFSRRHLAWEIIAMVRTFLVRGMLVGVVAGLLSFGFLKIYGEPQVDRAIAFETQMDEARHAAEHANGAHAGMHMSEEEEP